MIAPSDLETLRWLEPWSLLPPERRQALERELARELPAEHELTGSACIAIAARGDCDDALFIVDGTRLAIVHLTWSRETDPAWPHTVLVPDVATFVTAHMEPDHAALVG